MGAPPLFLSNNHHETEVVNFLNHCFHEAASLSAADVHFQEEHGHVRVRFRIQGLLRDFATIHDPQAKLLDEKLRSRADLSSADRHIALDGRMFLHFPDRHLDIRMSIIPTVVGQNTVCRLLDQSNAGLQLADIGMTESVRAAINAVLANPSGMMLLTGPTGSGKTTLLYAMLNALNNSSRHIVTIENPVEYQVEGLTQINVDHHVSFAKALRSVLRQDPDVILVGEIRDAETADIAVQAAITGHLVLSTVHSDNSALGVTRLVDLGVDPHTLATALRAVTAQRLVARLTPAPHPMAPPDEVMSAWLRTYGIHGRGYSFPSVHSDNNFRGMLPIIEMFLVDQKVRHAIPLGASAIVEAAASQPQFETLASAGVALATAGATTLEEVVHAIGSAAPLIPSSRRLGRVLVDIGFITDAQLNAALVKQLSLRERGTLRSLGEILADEGYCTWPAIVAGLGASEAAVTAANYYIRIGRITDAQLKNLAESWRLTPSLPFFTLLVEHGVASERELHLAPSLDARASFAQEAVQ
ncbi:MAG: ATPase, T2SS/T4P/T4SS family [Kiritimatiellae bacterium]|nr:ATPase, T2SS/T4P/T4SS family [Kiritimatiellia bacterium]